MQTAFERDMLRSCYPEKNTLGNRTANGHTDVHGSQRFIEENGLDAMSTPNGTPTDRNGNEPFSPKSAYID